MNLKQKIIVAGLAAIVAGFGLLGPIATQAYGTSPTPAPTIAQMMQMIETLKQQIQQIIALIAQLKPQETCGNGICRFGETAATCPTDCAKPTNDNGKEKCVATGGAWKYSDCASACVFKTRSERLSGMERACVTMCLRDYLCECPTGKYWASREEGCIAKFTNACGNGVCDTYETPDTCPADCETKVNFTPRAIVTSYTQPTSVSPATLTSTFNVEVTAKNGDVYLPREGAFTVAVLKNNETDSTNYHIGTIYSQPTGTAIVGNSYKIAKDTTATFAAKADFKTTVAGYYRLQMAIISWSTLDGGGYTNWSPSLPSIWSGQTIYLNGSNTGVCGNGTCETGETVTNCSADCNTISCIGVNEGHEIKQGQSCCAGLKPLVEKYSQLTENWSCVPMPTSRTLCANCGNGICGPGESYCSCPQDCCTPGTISGCKVCGTNPSQVWVDDNTKCSNGQICSGGKCLTTAICGNGTCETGETNANCAKDCPGLVMSCARENETFIDANRQCCDGLQKTRAACSDATCYTCKKTCAGEGQTINKLYNPLQPSNLPTSCCAGLTAYSGANYAVQDGVCTRKQYTVMETSAVCLKCGDGVCNSAAGENICGCPADCAAPVCNNECSSVGAKQCSGNSYQTCGNYDTDNCLEWSTATACASYQICQNGICGGNPAIALKAYGEVCTANNQCASGNCAKDLCFTIANCLSHCR